VTYLWRFLYIGSSYGRQGLVADHNAQITAKEDVLLGVETIVGAVIDIDSSFHNTVKAFGPLCTLFIAAS